VEPFRADAASPLEIQRMAEAETKAAFNPEYKAKIKAESLEKYPDVDVGDKLTVPMRMGASFVDREGTLRSVGVDYIKVNFGGANDVKILKVDLNPDIAPRSRATTSFAAPTTSPGTSPWRWPNTRRPQPTGSTPRTATSSTPIPALGA
jgi:hypothetical protein